MTATLDRPGPAGAEAAVLMPTWRDRFQPLVTAGGGWSVTALITLIAGLLRFIRLDQPATTLNDKGGVGPGDIFDEVYYACDSHTLWKYGVEHATVANSAFCTPTNDGSFIVHPPLGKWFIGLGEQMFGFNTFGWRFFPAVFGTLTVLLVVRIGRRLTGSTVLGGLAGLLLAFDGLHFVQSRVAMLDVFLCFWIVATFGALLVDREVVRQRLAAAPDPAVVRLGWRPWRVLAGVCAGAAVATKWSGLFPLAVLVVLTLVWEVGARRAAGIPEQQPWRLAVGFAVGAGSLVLLPIGGWGGIILALLLVLAGAGWEGWFRWQDRDLGVPSAVRLLSPLLLSLALLPAVLYLVSWTGWFVTSTGYDRHWAHSSFPLWGTWRSFWHYHWEIWNFHDTLVQKHPYQSHALSWPFLGRPVSYYYPSNITTGIYGCKVASCSREVLAIGTPAVWWAMIPASIGLAARWVAKRDWRASALLVLWLVSIVAWIPSDLKDRTMFLFYALPSLPFTCLGIALLAGWLLGPAGTLRRAVAAGAVGVYTSLVIWNFVYLYPILAAVTIPYQDWYSRMWFRSWI